MHLIGVMSGRKERSEGNGVGIKLANADKVDEVVEMDKDEEDEDEEEWKPGDEGRRMVYNKNKWFLVEEWKAGSFKSGGRDYDRRFSDRGGANIGICGAN